MELSQRSLSLGIQTILLRALGTVPGPVAFGYVMDTTCLIWRNDPRAREEAADDGCHEDELSVGSCLVYDNLSMSMYVLGIVMAWRFCGALFFAGRFEPPCFDSLFFFL